MKIDYNFRSKLKEAIDNDVDLIISLIKKYKLPFNSICEIPCNKERNLSLCDHFKKVVFADINKKILISINRGNHNNLITQVCDIKDVSRIRCEILISMRQSLQIFNLNIVFKFIDSAIRNLNIKYLIFDLYDFDSPLSVDSPSYLKIDHRIVNTEYNLILKRKSFIVKHKKYYKLKHIYMKKDEIIYKQSIIIYNHSLEKITQYLSNKGVKFHVLNKKLVKTISNYVIILVEV